MKVLPQIRLRALFLIFVCAAVGLTCATAPKNAENPNLKGLGITLPELNYYYALLTAAAMAMVIGLTEQVIALKRWQLLSSLGTCSLRFARGFAICWRLGLAALIGICLLGRVLLSRGVLSLPGRGDSMFYEVFPDVLLSIAIIVVLVDSVRRRWRADRQRQSYWIAGPVWLAGLALATLFIWPDSGLITFLVHIATEGIESAQRYHRPGVFPNHQLEHFRTFWSSSVALVAVLLAASLLAIGRSVTYSRAKFTSLSILYISFLGAAAAHCIWFYDHEFPRISPDMASVGFAGTWFDWVSCSVLVAIVITAGAYRLAVGTSWEPDCGLPICDSNEAHAFHESTLWLVLLIGSVVLYFFENVRGFPSFFGAPAAYEFLGYFLRSPEAYLAMAIAVLSGQLCWARWKRRNYPATWDLQAINPARFVWNWLSLALLTIVGLPTVAIYSFSFWLGPWYLYGPK